MITGDYFTIAPVAWTRRCSKLSCHSWLAALGVVAPLPITLPRPVMLWWFRSFGKRSPLICAWHSAASPFIASHHSWSFLTIVEWFTLAEAVPVIAAYAQLRQNAFVLSVVTLQLAWPPPSRAPLSHHWAWLMGCALLWFDFWHGDLIQWLGGEYTNAHQDWEQVFDIVDSIWHFPVPPGSPKVDFDRAHWICMEGAPLAGIFECSFAAVQAWNIYDNHPPLSAVLNTVWSKLTKKEELIYHLLFPCFLW